MPAIELLAWRRNCRIFQKKTAIYVIKAVFDAAEISADMMRWVL